MDVGKRLAVRTHSGLVLGPRPYVLNGEGAVVPSASWSESPCVGSCFFTVGLVPPCWVLAGLDTDWLGAAGILGLGIVINKPGSS